MYFFLFSFRYLALRDANGYLVVWRDVPPTLLATIVIGLLFNLGGQTNFFGENGFVDKVGALTGSLTGFYVAGLLAVATFATQSSALDKPIKVGPIYRSRSDVSSKIGMTRREYVCSIFGYLAFLSLIQSVASALFAGIASEISSKTKGIFIVISKWAIDLHDVIRILVECAFILTFVHLMVTSGYGMYYLVFKIYSKEPRLKEPRSTPRISSFDETDVD